MEQKNGFESVIRDLRNAAAAINSAADSLAKMCAEEESDPPAPPPENTPTKEDVRAVLAKLSGTGHTAEVKELLRKHGAEMLSGIDPAEYTAIIKEAEEIGNG